MKKAQRWIPRGPQGLLMVLLFGALATAVLAGGVWYLADILGASHDGQAGSEYEGTRLDGPAPGFQLTDQYGATVALSDFLGRVVVLAFMDSRCDETCPLTALELRTAHQALGAAAEQVVFLGVNVNVNFNGLEDVQAATEEFQLDGIPTWRFLTGSAEKLFQVWKAYAIDVIPPDEPGEEDFDHTPGIYIIDQGGDRRWYVSTPLLGEGLVQQWSGPGLGQLLVRHITRLLK